MALLQVQQAAADAIIRLYVPEAAATAASGAADGAAAAGAADPAAADVAVVPAAVAAHSVPSQPPQQQPTEARSSQQHQHAALAPGSQTIEDVAPAMVPAAAVKAEPQDAAPVPLPPLPPLRCTPDQAQPVAQPLPPDLYAPSLLGTPRAAWLLPQQPQGLQSSAPWPPQWPPQQQEQGLPSGQRWPPPLQQQWPPPLQQLPPPQQGHQQSLSNSQPWAQPSAPLPFVPEGNMQLLQLLTPLQPGSQPQQPQLSAWQMATQTAGCGGLPATHHISAASSQCDFPQMGLGSLSQPPNPAAWEQYAVSPQAQPAWQPQLQALSAPGGTAQSSAAVNIAGASPSLGKRSLAMATGGPGTASVPAAATAGASDPAVVGATSVPLPQEPAVAIAAAAMLGAVKTDPVTGEGAAKTASSVDSKPASDAADAAAGSSRPKRRRTKTARLLEWERQQKSDVA